MLLWNLQANERGSDMFVIETDRANYYTDDEGRVLARTNGPRGWNYSGKWVILGALKRHHSALHNLISLQECADGADMGHGIIVDNDHGTLRQWGTERARSIRRA